MFHIYFGESLPNIVDWLTLGVSGVTAVFFIWMFTEQLKINKATLSKHRREIRPYFVCQFSREHNDYYLHLTNATAFRVLFTLKNNNPLCENDNPTPIWELSNDPVEVTYSLNDSSTKHELIWNIVFYDEDGRKYEQKVYCDDFGGSVYTIAPILLKDVT